MILGNIKEKPIKDILSTESPQISKMIDDRVSAINKCEEKQCGYFYICNGGCPYHSFIASNGENVSHLDCLCEGKLLLFQYLDSVLEHLSTDADKVMD